MNDLRLRILPSNMSCCKHLFSIEHSAGLEKDSSRMTSNQEAHTISFINAKLKKLELLTYIFP